MVLRIPHSFEHIAEVAKWTTAPVLKTGSAHALREFESPPQRRSNVLTLILLFTFTSVTLKDMEVRDKGNSCKTGSMEDVDGGGDLDPVVQFVDEGTFVIGDCTATITLFTYGGVKVIGTDTVRIAPVHQTCINDQLFLTRNAIRAGLSRVCLVNFSIISFSGILSARYCFRRSNSS